MRDLSFLHIGLTIVYPFVLVVLNRMKLTFSAEDETGIAMVTFWDDKAAQLLGKTVLELKAELPPVVNGFIV